MIEMITHFSDALWQLSIAMAPYILFGLIFAGILHEIVPQSLVSKHLGNSNISSVIKATLFGIPLPVCSCGVIPLATAIKQSGASKGSTLSFLISTPITGVDSILATYGIFGVIFTIYRIISSMIIAIFAGILTNLFDKEAPKPKFTATLSLSPLTNNTQSSCCSGSDCAQTTTDKKPFSIQNALKYAFVTLLGDIAKPLFWGLLLGALITTLMPENLAQMLQDHTWLSYLIVVAIAVPMYVCATASLPIAAGLMLSGVSAGAAFVFLSAGPATNTVTMGVVKKMLGTKSLAIYLSVIVIGSILFGLGLDAIFDAKSINPASLVHMDEHTGILSAVSAVILWGFVGYFLLQPFFNPKKSCCS